MKADVIDWHKLAYLYSEKGLELHDVVKASYIFQIADIIEDDKGAYGYGVLKNRPLYQAIIYAMIVGYPKGLPVSQAEMARAMGWNRSTVSRLIKQMEEENKISYDRSNSTYEIHESNNKDIPDWIMEFGKALIELQFDDELKQKLKEHYAHFELIRGFAVLWEEMKSFKPLGRLRSKFAGD